MSIENHPALSGMTPEQKAEYLAFAQFAGRNESPANETPARKKPMATEELVYIDRDGLYGDATGLLIVKMSDLSDAGRKAYEEAKDQTENLLEWMTGYLRESNVDVGITTVSKTSKLFPSSIHAHSKGVLGRLRGKK